MSRKIIGLFSFVLCGFAVIFVTFWIVSCSPAPTIDDEREAELIEEIYDFDRFEADPIISPYPESDESRTVVVWMSIDGMRHDYLDRTNTPNFDRLIREGAFTRELVPGFPSLTFPSHTTQATGVRVEDHGVSGNSFYDMEHDRHYAYSGDPDLLEAEPIWTTAARQGVRVAVYDWIKSYNQKGPHAGAYYAERYSGDMSDRERMRLILETWAYDVDEEPLRLFMGYTVTPDLVGHEFGPDAPEIADIVARMDRLYEWFTDQIIKMFDSKMSPRDELYFFITTDHGMSPVHSLVHIHRITGLEDNEEAVVVTSGSIGHIFLHRVEPAEERIRMEAEILDRLGAYEFVQAGRREHLPERWGYNHPTRVGDIVVVLDPGYTFHRGIDADVVPVEERGWPLGMHGYDPETDPNMLGIGIFWRYPEPLGGVYLGRVDSLQLHSTVAYILGIEPAAGAHHKPIALERPRESEPILQEMP